MKENGSDYMKSFFKYLPMLATACILLSCSKVEEEEVVIPSYVMEKSKYIKLLCDMSMAEAAVNVNIKAIATQQYDSVYAFNPLKENIVSQVQYDSTTAFYSRHPQMFKNLYDEVLTELSKIQAKKMNFKKDSSAHDTRE